MPGPWRNSWRPVLSHSTSKSPTGDPIELLGRVCRTEKGPTESMRAESASQGLAFS